MRDDELERPRHTRLTAEGPAPRAAVGGERSPRAVARAQRPDRRLDRELGAAERGVDALARERVEESRGIAHQEHAAHAWHAHLVREGAHRVDRCHDPRAGEPAGAGPAGAIRSVAGRRAAPPSRSTASTPTASSRGAKAPVTRTCSRKALGSARTRPPSAPSSGARPSALAWLRYGRQSPPARSA